MPDIQQRIADIIGREYNSHPDRIAEAVVSELGLTQQRANIYDDGSTTPKRTEIRYVTEWVSE